MGRFFRVTLPPPPPDHTPSSVQVRLPSAGALARNLHGCALARNLHGLARRRRAAVGVGTVPAWRSEVGTIRAWLAAYRSSDDAGQGEGDRARPPTIRRRIVTMSDLPPI